MPDCSNDALAKVLRDIADNASASTAAFADKVRAIDFTSGLAQTTDVLGDLGEAALDSAASQIIANGLNATYAQGLGSIGRQLATILSGGHLAYLGVAGFLFTLLRYELESRVIVSSNFLNDVQDLGGIISLMINLLDKRGDEDDLILQKAYEEIFGAHSLLQDLYDQLEALKYYSNDSVPTITDRLSEAQEIMETPVLDALAQIAEDAHFAPQWMEIGHNALRNPQSVYDDLYHDVITENQEDYTGPETRNQDYQVYTSGQAASRSKQLDTFLTGIFEYIDYSGTAAMLDMKVKELGLNVVRYLPLGPIEKVALLSNFAPKISAAPDSSRNLFTVDFTDISYRGIIEDNSSFPNRNLGGLNTTIKKRLGLLSTYTGAFGDMALVNNLSNLGVSKVYDQLTTLKDDIEQYVPHPVGSPDQTSPQINIPTTAAKSFKMMAWRSKIEAVKRNLNTLDSTFGQQAEGIGASYDNLDFILELIDGYTNDETGLYNDDNDNTPAGEDAFIQLNALIGHLFDDLTNRGGLLAIQNQLAECRLSLGNSIREDKVLIDAIKTFTDSILDTPGMQEQVAFLEGVLNNEELVSKNNTIKYLVDEFKQGNIQLVANLGLGAITDTVELGQAGLNAVQNIPSVGEMSDAFKVAMGSVGSAFTNIGDCLGQLGRPSVTNELKEAGEKAKIQARIVEEKLNATIQSNAVAGEQLQIRKELLTGTTVPEAELPVTQENVSKVEESVKEVYEKQGLTTKESLIK
ncbi:MAG: hypothetical protein H8D23_00845 [Candidatus Brocadiales bacterium]|nr:hypothetical protein [Candidatus Brocadiales bacterium]